MNRDDVTREQAAAIVQALCGPVGYLYRLKNRMERAGFPADDPLNAKVVAAYEALFTLDVEVRGMSSTLTNWPK